MGVYRPTGVTALAIIFLILGVASIISVIAVEVMLTSAYQNMVISNIFNNLLTFYTVNEYPSWFDVDISLFLLTSVLTNAISFATSMQSLTNIMYFAIALGLVSSVLCFTASYGLFSMKKWGYYLALVIGILSLPSIIGIILVIYLLVSDIKYEFE
ncbi:MAG: hypothetical protein QW279_07020 [Candidatus Jordarchaeaceae archaeon]